MNKKIIGFLIIYGVFLMCKKSLTDKQEEIDITARTIWGEARGEGVQGMQAVANVITNRVNAGMWYGRSFKDVCLKPRQFAAWEDLNRPQMIAATKNTPLFPEAVEIAKKAVAGTLPDITKGANHYHRAGINPYWADPAKRTTIIGRHVFFKL